MLCPICSKVIENPTWKTCNSRACGNVYNRYKSFKTLEVNKKDIVDKIRSSRMKIHNLQNDIRRLTFIIKLYDKIPKEKAR